MMSRESCNSFDEQVEQHLEIHDWQMQVLEQQGPEAIKRALADDKLCAAIPSALNHQSD